MKTATISPKKLEKERKAWLASVARLADQVESWAKDRHWPVHRENKEVQEPALGVYTVPVIRVLAAAGQVQLDPIARFAGRSDWVHSQYNPFISLCGDKIFHAS